MTASSEKPTIVLLQGSSYPRDLYAQLIDILEAKGYPVVFPQLPTLTGQDEPEFTSKTLADDAVVVQNHIEQLVQQQGKLVAVLMHSYGAVLGTEAIPQQVSRAYRRKQGLTGGVIHLFYICGMILTRGQSLDSIYHEVYKPTADSSMESNGCIRMNNPLENIFNDLPLDEARRWTSSMVKQSYGGATYRLTRESYRYLPSTYLITELDVGVPRSVQSYFASITSSSVVTMRAGHCPMLSKPNELVDLVTKAVNGAI
ncbi:hypothetical protein CDD81_5644 [Ophiocordyceps australis]|uniref:AB hydrolase-1 domain-containing protein n=1 Tax=Ophiocordyceps australis TaxID=1399860 RepID=A0A2C5Y7Q4_9HYPO|nr:hypothetical protein CDD81_5644 [Ophiocordyceps australis]